MSNKRCLTLKGTHMSKESITDQEGWTSVLSKKVALLKISNVILVLFMELRVIYGRDYREEGNS